ncbi:MAG: hypothetical protein LBH98_05460 [Chitinispirillales bacterium]|jgi:uncharacterized protein YbaR (Trm112 family)|nr:hypothetical protein [Chitinispirillales bacterium]
MNQDLIKILCCPETKQKVDYADKEIVREINRKIAAKQLRNREGVLLTERIDDGLIREDKKYLYPIKSDIPIMLINEAIEL